MGIFGGLANFAQNAGPTAGAVVQAQAQGSAQRNQQALQMLMLDRQQKEQAVKDALMQSQTGEANARIGDIAAQQKIREYQALHPKQEAPIMGSPEWIAAETAKAKIGAQYAYHPPHNIDPLSPEGIAAQAKLKTAKGGGDGTPAQQLAGAQYSVAKDAAPDIDAYHPGMVSKALSHVPGVGNWLLGHFDSDFQNLDRDSRQFIEAYMHAQGGRRVTQQEYDRLKGIYIPTAGDAPEVLARKVSARQTALQSMHRMAGPVGDQVDEEMGRSAPKLSPGDAVRAQQDPGFAAWLKQQGHLP